MWREREGVAYKYGIRALVLLWVLSQSINCPKKRHLIRLFELSFLAGRLEKLGQV